MTAWLPYDYSRCANLTCELHEKCLRWLSPPRPDGPQSYTAYPGGDDCHGFIPMEADQ